jgi:hypothetical protein
MLSLDASKWVRGDGRLLDPVLQRTALVSALVTTAVLLSVGKGGETGV